MVYLWPTESNSSNQTVSLAGKDVVSTTEWHLVQNLSSVIPLANSFDPAGDELPLSWWWMSRWNSLAISMRSLDHKITVNRVLFADKRTSQEVFIWIFMKLSLMIHRWVRIKGYRWFDSIHPDCQFANSHSPDGGGGGGWVLGIYIGGGVPWHTKKGGS